MAIRNDTTRHTHHSDVDLRTQIHHLEDIARQCKALASHVLADLVNVRTVDDLEELDRATATASALLRTLEQNLDDLERLEIEEMKPHK